MHKNNACKVRSGLYSARFNAARGPFQNNALVSDSFFLTIFASCWFLLVQSGTCVPFNSPMKLRAYSFYMCRCSLFCIVLGKWCDGCRRLSAVKTQVKKGSSGARCQSRGRVGHSTAISAVVQPPKLFAKYATPLFDSSFLHFLR